MANRYTSLVRRNRIAVVLGVSAGLIALVFFVSSTIQTAQAVALTWDGGGADSNWSTCDNWTTDKCPAAGDGVTFNALSTKNSTIDGSWTALGGEVSTLDVEAGYTGTITQDSSISIANNIALSGGTFNAAAGTLSIGGNFANAGTFTAPGGTVSFDDAAKTSVISGSTTFNNFSSTTPDKLINVTAGTTQTITGLFTVTGAASQLVTLSSTSAGTAWNLALNGTQSISYINVQDSDASTGATAIAGAGSIDAGNNVNWLFLSSATEYTATGWGWIGNAVEWTATPEVSTGATPGIIFFNCASVPAIYGGCPSNYSVQLEYGGCDEVCDVTGYAWVGAYDPASESAAYPLGWIVFDPDVSSGTPTDLGDDPLTSEDERLDAHWNENTHELYGWARFYTLEQYEDNVYGAGQANDWGWIKLRYKDPATSADVYGVTFDAATTLFAGWAWNDNGSDGTTEVEGSGVGWVQFDGNLTTASGTDWLQTVQGDVYAHDGITATNAAPSGYFNATYLIQSDNSVLNFTSQIGAPVTGSGATVPDDNGNQVYRGLLDSIHVNELLAQVDPADSDTSGNCDDTLLLAKTAPLKNRVFYCAGSMDINNSLTFSNGSAGELGAGTIIVGGDLRIHDSLNYINSSPLSNISALASVAWIVLGKVEIDATVSELVGTYVVLGEAGTSPDFDTGTGSLPLELSGTVMARSFSFGRFGIGSSSAPQAAETFIYDGRLVANTPPGFEDWSAVLPSFGSN